MTSPMKVDGPEAVQAYIDYKVKQECPKHSEADDRKAASDKLRAEADNKQYIARMAEIKLKELEGTMHNSEDVKTLVTAMVMTIRSSLLALPGRLAMDLALLNDASEVSVRIQKEVYEILNELSNFEYNEEEYKKLVRDRMGWQDETPEEEN